MTPKQMHAAMAQIVDKPGYPLLKHYRSDFEELDLTYLENAWHEEARMLWVVRKNGTHLIPLGVHPKMEVGARAVFQMEGEKEFYLLSNKGISQVGQARAEQEVSRLQWRYEKDGGIFKGHLRLADVVEVTTGVERTPMPKEDGEAENAALRFKTEPVYDVKLKLRVASSELSLGDLIGIRIHAECAASAHGGDLMIATRNVQLGEIDLGKLMDKSRAKWLQAAQDKSRQNETRSGQELLL